MLITSYFLRYNCSAEVWSYDAVEGAKPLLTYHDAETKRGLEDRTEPKGLGGTEKGEDERGVWLGTSIIILPYYCCCSLPKSPV